MSIGRVWILSLQPIDVIFFHYNGRLNNSMPATIYDQIIVTGCSHSCGMEMNDHLLPTARTFKEREVNITKWGRHNLKLPHKDIHVIKRLANQHWEDKEREKSWPALLEHRLGIPVTNLAHIGASLGKTLVSYSEYLRSSWKGQKTAVIHQIPEYGRMYMRLSKEHGRTNIVPGEIENIGFNKKYFSKQIESIEKKYKDMIMNDDYMKSHRTIVLDRLSKLSKDRGIAEFYVFNRSGDSCSSTVILDSLTEFRKNYTTGTFTHTNDPRFNSDFCDLIIPYL